MRKGLLLGLTASVISGMVLLITPAAFANHAQFPSRANRYRVSLVRAMDQCTGGAISVVAVGDPVPNGDCLQANVVTDDPPAPGATMGSGTLTVSRTSNQNGKVGFFGLGFAPGARVSIRLSVRTTQSGIHTKHPPGSNKRVTYQDWSVECGNQTTGLPNCTGAFGARATGAVVGSETLKDCLTQSGVPTGLRAGNLEILDASLFNCDTGKVIAKPGIKQGPSR
jgi:hypothetical protein